MAHDVFISYSSKDKTTADAICNNLEKNGMRCWIAPRDALAGKNYGKSIVEAIKEAKILVLVLSSNANQSDFVMRELERAVSTGTTIIPFRIEEIDPSESIEFFIASAHWLDALTPPLEAHINSLTQTVGKLLNTNISNMDKESKKPQESNIYNKLTHHKLVSGMGIVLIVLLIFSIFLSTSSSNFTKLSSFSSTSSPNSYEGNGITFKYPGNWENVSNIQSPVIAAVRDPNSKDSSGDYLTTAYIREIKSSNTLKREMNISLTKKINEIPSLRIISNTTKKIDGISAYQINVQYYNDQVQMKAIDIWLESIDYKYEIVCTAPYNEFELQSNNFKMITESFTFNYKFSVGFQ